ncbi:MAG: hypothetical protein R2762_22815 [Bryobacteraceae bacterium]
MSRQNLPERIATEVPAALFLVDHGRVTGDEGLGRRFTLGEVLKGTVLA